MIMQVAEYLVIVFVVDLPIINFKDILDLEVSFTLFFRSLVITLIDILHNSTEFMLLDIFFKSFNLNR